MRGAMQVGNSHGAFEQPTQDQPPLTGWEGLFLLVREGLVELQDSGSSDQLGSITIVIAGTLIFPNHCSKFHKEIW